MQAKIIKTVQESFPQLRLIGKKYTNLDRNKADGGYAHIWSQWFDFGWFEILKSLKPKTNIENGYLGFMRYDIFDFNQTFEYWIGMFFEPWTPVPEGFDYLDLQPSNVGVCFIEGIEPDIYNKHQKVLDMLRLSNFNPVKVDNENKVHFFERYNHQRFSKKDAEGHLILDYGFFLE